MNVINVINRMYTCILMTIGNKWYLAVARRLISLRKKNTDAERGLAPKTVLFVDREPLTL